MLLPLTQWFRTYTGFCCISLARSAVVEGDLGIFEAQFFDDPIGADAGESVFGVVRGGKILARRPGGAHAVGAAHDPVYVIYGDPSVIEGPLGGEQRVGAQAVIQLA